MQKRILQVILVLISLVHLSAKAQDSIATPDSSQLNRKAFYKALAFESAYYAGAMLILQNTWYRDHPIVSFHFYNDTKGYLQVDKFGHAFGGYVESYIGSAEKPLVL